MICAICGELITGNISKDHVFPRAIYKWQEEYLPLDEFKMLKSSIESTRNVVKTHHDCNICKEDTLFDISTLHISEKQRKKLDSVHEEIEPYICSYMYRKSQLVEKQGGKCFCCKKMLAEDKILRRIDNSMPRTVENGCIVCHDCNQNNNDFLGILE